MEKEDIKAIIVHAFEIAYLQYRIEHSDEETKQAVADVLADLINRPHSVYDHEVFTKGK